MESAPRAVMAAGNVRYDIPVGGAALQQAGVSDTWASPFIWQQDGGPLWHKARCWHLACKGSCRVDEQGGWGGGWAEVLGGGRRMRNRWQERQVGDISTRLVLRSNEETVCQREETALKARKKWKWSQSLILSSLFLVFFFSSFSSSLLPQFSSCYLFSFPPSSFLHSVFLSAANFFVLLHPSLYSFNSVSSSVLFFLFYSFFVFFFLLFSSFIFYRFFSLSLSTHSCLIFSFLLSLAYFIFVSSRFSVLVILLYTPPFFSCSLGF